MPGKKKSALDKWAAARDANTKAVADAVAGKENIHDLANRLSKEANETSFSKSAEKSRDEHMAAASAMHKAAKDAPELKRFYESRAADHEKKAAGYQLSVDARKRDEQGRFTS